MTTFTLENNTVEVVPARYAEGQSLVRLTGKLNGHDFEINTAMPSSYFLPPRPSYQVDVTTLTTIQQISNAFEKACGQPNLSHKYLDALLLKLLDIVRLKATTSLRHVCTNDTETAQVASYMSLYSTIKDTTKDTDIVFPTIPDGIKGLVPYAEAGFHFKVTEFNKERYGYNLTLSIDHNTFDLEDYNYGTFYSNNMVDQQKTELDKLVHSDED